MFDTFFAPALFEEGWLGAKKSHRGKGGGLCGQAMCLAAVALQPKVEGRQFCKA